MVGLRPHQPHLLSSPFMHASTVATCIILIHIEARVFISYIQMIFDLREHILDSTWTLIYFRVLNPCVY